jgi:hypothetical protein
MFARVSRWMALGVILLLPTQLPAANLLTNPSFESGLDGWTTFGNAYSETAYAQDGLRSLKLYGNWWYAWDATGAFQNLSAAEGQTWTFSGVGLDPSADPVTGGNQNFALLKIIWFDGPNGTGNMLQPLAGPGAVFGDNPGIESAQLNANTPLDAWQPLSAAGQAPADTQSVQVLALFLQPNWEGGSLWFDNLVATPEPLSLALLGLGGLMLAHRRR